MDLMQYAEMGIAGVLIIPLVLGWVEAAKKLGVNGKGSFVMALVLGCLFAALWQAINTGLIPETVLPWVRVAVVGLGGGVAATGLYDLRMKLA